jgi:hypothetical protein
MRYERVGLPADMADPAPNIRSVGRYLNLDPEDTDRSKRGSRLSMSDLIATQYYLSDDPRSARDWAGRVLSFADDYFLGSWRDRRPSGNYRDQPPDRTYQDRNLPWQDEFQACLLWGSCLGAWEHLGRIARALPDDVMLDVEQTEQNRAWLLAVAGLVRGETWDQQKEWAEMVRSGRRRQERM